MSGEFGGFDTIFLDILEALSLNSLQVSIVNVREVCYPNNIAVPTPPLGNVHMAFASYLLRLSPIHSKDEIGYYECTICKFLIEVVFCPL